MSGPINPLVLHSSPGGESLGRTDPFDLAHATGWNRRAELIFGLRSAMTATRLLGLSSSSAGLG